MNPTVRVKLVHEMVTAARGIDPTLGEELASISDPDCMAKVVAALVKAVTGRSVATSIAAVRALGRAANYAANYGGGAPSELLDAVPAVVDAAADRHEEVRIAALNALEKFAAEAGPEVVAAFSARDYSSASAPEAIAAIYALRACGQDVAAAGVGWLASLLEHTDADVVELVCRTLGWIGPEAVGFTEQLISLATGPNRQLRRAAASALIEIDPTGLVVSKRFSDPAQREEVLMAMRDKGAEGRDTRAKIRRSDKRPGTRSNRLVMIDALLKHHRYGTDESHFEAATGKDLQKLTEWGQTKVSRTMKEIFGDDGMAKYKQVCRAGGLARYLQPPNSIRRRSKPVEE